MGTGSPGLATLVVKGRAVPLAPTERISGFSSRCPWHPLKGKIGKVSPRCQHEKVAGATESMAQLATRWHVEQKLEQRPEPPKER